MLLLTYDLAKKTRDGYRQFYKVRDRYENKKVSASSYILLTSETPESLLELLKPFLSPNDTVFILALAGPMVGIRPK